MPRRKPKITKPVKVAIGQNSRPRMNRHVGSAICLINHASRVTPASSSRGLRNSWSLTKKIDSRLDMFFVNGHHSIVTVSPTIVRNTST